MMFEAYEGTGSGPSSVPNISKKNNGDWVVTRKVIDWADENFTIYDWYIIDQQSIRYYIIRILNKESEMALKLRWL